MTIVFCLKHPFVIGIIDRPISKITKPGFLFLKKIQLLRPLLITTVNRVESILDGGGSKNRQRWLASTDLRSSTYNDRFDRSIRLLATTHPAHEGEKENEEEEKKKEK